MTKNNILTMLPVPNMPDYKNTLNFAKDMDSSDPLRSYRRRFYIPEKKGQQVIYFCGNSLGLQPDNVAPYIREELDSWKKLGVEGHFSGTNPWVYYHRLTKRPLANLVGARPEEIVAMNHLTANLHFMLVSFYRPQGKRFRILTEAGAFPSDQYALESQVKFHGFDPEEAILEITPREDEHVLRTDDILHAIRENAEELALVMVGGLQYYTGQWFNLKAITTAAQEAGCFAGFDLAHAIGNIPMRLHDWNVDFAVWCSYKYLNAGPGATAGVFVHEKHASRPEIPRFAGWWGHNESERFKMEKGFQPMYGADGWQVSNAPVLSLAALRASLEIFDRAGIDALREKSIRLTGFLEYLLNEIDRERQYFTVITPSRPEARGCQLSLLIQNRGKEVFDQLVEAGVVADWREPGAIRVAPVPLYNTFTEVYEFSRILEAALRKSCR